MATAADIIKAFRDNTGYYDSSVVFDGYATDRKPKGDRVLPLLNRALRMYAQDGFNECEFAIPLVSGQLEYLLDSSFYGITSQWLYNTVTGKVMPVSFTTANRLDERFSSQWRNISTSMPTEVYTIGTRGIGFSAKPNAASEVYELRFKAKTTVDDMELSTDVPGQIKDSSGAIVLDGDGNVKSALPENLQLCLAHYPGFIIATRRGDTATAEIEREFWENSRKDVRALSKHRAPSGESRITVARSQFTPSGYIRR